MEQPKLAQMDKVLHKWFTAMQSEGKSVTGLMIIEKAKFITMKWKELTSAHSLRAEQKKKNTGKNFRSM